MKSLPVVLRRRIILGLLLLLPSGCASTPLLSWKNARAEKADERNPAVKIVCIWEPAEGNGSDGFPTGGFSGQIMFFTQRSPSPVQVNGDIRIYLFDGNAADEKDAKPIHQFDFLGDAWSAHGYHSMLGPAYNVFVPYTPALATATNCSLRVRIVPQEGPTIYSELVKVTLPPPKNGHNIQGPASRPTLNTNPSSRFEVSLKKQRILLHGNSKPRGLATVSTPLANGSPQPPGESTIGADLDRHQIPFAMNNRTSYSTAGLPTQPADNSSYQTRLWQADELLHKRQEGYTQKPLSNPKTIDSQRHRRHRLSGVDSDVSSSLILPDAHQDEAWGGLNDGGGPQDHPLLEFVE